MNKPIKFVNQDGVLIKSDGDYDVTIIRKMTLSEIAELFGLDDIKITDGKIGYWTVDGHNTHSNLKN